MQLHPAFSVQRTCALIIVLFLFGLPEGLRGAAPPNDLCSQAILVPGAGPFPYLSPVVDLTDATTVGDPPLPPSTLFDTNVNRSVWFRLVPTVTTNYTLSVGADTATAFGDSPTPDTSMAIYTSSAGCSGPMTLYAFNEDSGLLLSALSTNFVAGRDYYILVWVGRIETATNNLFLQLRVSRPLVPTNDTCTGAEVIPASGPFPYDTLVTDTTLATDDPQVSPSCAPEPPDGPHRGVWYQFTPALSDTYIFSTRDNKTTVDDTLVSLYTSSGACAGPFTEVSCNDNSFGRATIARALMAGTTYYLLLWDNSSEFIPGETLAQMRVLRATAPTVTTLPTSSIASTGAVLNGTVNANALLTRYWFEWGPTSGLGSTSQVKLIVANSTATSDASIPVNGVNGLVPNTLYHYRFVATNSAGKSRGDELTFVWSNTPPHLISPQRVGATGTSFNFQFLGNPGQLYLIQNTTDFVSWQPMGQATNVGTAFQYTHRNAVDSSRHFRVWAP